MNKQLIYATISYVVLSLAWAYPWHVLWFHDVYVSMGAITRSAPIVPLGLLSLVMQGLVLSYLYPRCYPEGRSISQGIKFMFISGTLIYTVMGFATAAKFAIAPIATFLAYHTVFQAVQFVMTGAALGYIYSRQA